MSLNRNDLIKQMNEASLEVLREKGYICFVDILIRMGKLTKGDYEAWRSRKVPYLEKVIKVNLVKVTHMLRTLQQNAKKGGLLASKTSYVSWGKGSMAPLRFSKSGDPNIEEAYSTHFHKPKTEESAFRGEANKKICVPSVV
jgi:hypothetical protein